MKEITFSSYTIDTTELNIWFKKITFRAKYYKTRFVLYIPRALSSKLRRTYHLLHTLGAGPRHAIYKTVTTTAFAGDADGDANIINETLWSWTEQVWHRLMVFCKNIIYFSLLKPSGYSTHHEV